MLRRNREEQICSEAPDSSECGAVSFLVAAMLLPMLMILSVVTIDFANFFGIRDELRRVLDQEARNALMQGLSRDRVEATVLSRMSNMSHMARLSSVTATLVPHRARVAATAEYQGSFLASLQGIIGQRIEPISFELESSVRVQRAAALIVIDREVYDGSKLCSDSGLLSAANFVDQLVTVWSRLASTEVAVAVVPGETEAADLLLSDGTDAVTRCTSKSSSSGFEVAGISGVTRGVSSNLALAERLLELAGPLLVRADVETRQVVFVMREPSYSRGYSLNVYDVFNEVSRHAGIAVDMATIVVNGTAGILRRPFEPGIDGVSLREIEAAESELAGGLLLSAVARAVTDRTILEH